MQIEDILVCNQCHSNYNKVDKLPLQLQCKHSQCKICCDQEIQQNGKIVCKICQKVDDRPLNMLQINKTTIVILLSPVNVQKILLNSTVTQNEAQKKEEINPQPQNDALPQQFLQPNQNQNILSYQQPNLQNQCLSQQMIFPNQQQLMAPVQETPQRYYDPQSYYLSQQNRQINQAQIMTQPQQMNPYQNYSQQPQQIIQPVHHIPQQQKYQFEKESGIGQNEIQNHYSLQQNPIFQNTGQAQNIQAYQNPQTQQKSNELVPQIPNQQIQVPLFVGNLTINTNEQQIKETFERVAPVSKIKLLKVEVTTSNRAAFVSVSADKVAEVLQKMNGELINGQKCTVVQFKNKNELQNLKVFVKNLPKSFGEAQIKEMFEQIGRISSVKLQKNADGSSRLMGYIIYDTIEAAKQAIQKFNNYQLN